MLPKEEVSPKKYGLDTLFRNSFNAFKVSLYDTIAYQVLFAILLSIVILPVLYILYDFLFVTKDYPALVNTDIGSFFFQYPRFYSGPVVCLCRNRDLLY